MRGLEEQALRQFVCKYSGDKWEELYEALFHYEAKLSARELWGKGDRGKGRPKHAAWRDTIIRALEARIQQRKEQREKRYLQKLEEKQLKAKGVSEAEARKTAAASAETMVAKAAEMKEKAALYTADMATMAPGSGASGVVRRPMPTFTAGSLLATDDDAAMIRERQRKAANARSNSLVRLCCGPFTRFVLGAVLVAACGLWVKNNGMLSSGGELTQALRSHQAGALAGLFDPNSAYQPLAVPLVPRDLAQKIFNTVNMGAAGLILLISAFLGRVMLGFFVLPAAAIAWLGILGRFPR